MTPSDFLALLEKHLADTGETPTAFGKRIANDPRFIFGLRLGREARYPTQQKVLAALRGTPKRKRAA